MIGYVYFLESDNGLIKIGKSANLEKRIINLARGNAAKLNLVGYLEDDIEKTDSLEVSLHKRFQYLRSHGEWFEFTDVIKKYISNHCITDCAVINRALWVAYHEPEEFVLNGVKKSREFNKKRSGKRDVDARETFRFIADHPGSTTRDISRYLKCTEGYARAILNDLLTRFVVNKETGTGRSLIYFTTVEEYNA